MLLLKKDSRTPLLAAIGAPMVVFLLLLPQADYHIEQQAPVTSKSSCFTREREICSSVNPCSHSVASLIACAGCDAIHWLSFVSSQAPLRPPPAVTFNGFNQRLLARVLV
jgi:hypothetical protein